MLGNSEQWITIRGERLDNPVLIYLGIGGSGADGFPASKPTLASLERNFVVVNLDQPGIGKSYGAVPIRSLTVDRFVAETSEQFADVLVNMVLPQTCALSDKVQ